MNRYDLTKEQYTNKLDKHRGEKRRNLDYFYILSVMPMIMLTYLQLFFNLSVISVLFYAIVQVSKVFYKDLQKHMEKQSYVLISTMVQCSKDFIKNGCSNEVIPPAIEHLCNEWSLCMNQDINGILASKETAIVLAQIINNFFGNLSDRTLYCSVTLLIGGVLLINALLICMYYPMKVKRKKK